jgi:hypothetical protein
MKLLLFDCDNTLWKIPYKENDEYMSNPKSILGHDFELVEAVINEYFNHKDENCKYGILTNRHINTEQVILTKLATHNLTFDYSLFRNEDRSKGNRLVKLLKELNGVTEVHFWDDKERHLNECKAKVEGLFPHINFNFHLVESTEDMLDKIVENQN